MRHPRFFRAVLVAVVGLASLWVAHTTYPQGTRSAVVVKRDAVLQAAKALQNQYEPYVSKSGAGASDVDRVSRKVWVAALKVPGKNNNAAAGFWLPPFSVEGMSLPGARVTARFVIDDVKGVVLAGLAVIDETAHSEAGGKNQYAMQRGVITLTTDPFTVQPSHKYRARAVLLVTDTYNPDMTYHEVYGGAGQIKEITWSF